MKRLDKMHISNNAVLGDIDIDLNNPKTGEPYSMVVFVGENGCGKTTLLNEISKSDNCRYVFLRQNSMFAGLSNESYKLICGKELYPFQNPDKKEISDNIANNKEACIELLKSLNDDALIDVYESGKLDHSRCGGEATRIIDGKKDYFDLNTLSSGQQEILLKIKTLKQAQITTDIVLLDEPETSLHPRWQKRIVYLIRDIVKDKDGNVPQLFIATHSEKVLESLIGKDDVLIIRLYKEDKIKYETINQMDLCFPSPTFAELDYVVFHIPSMDYHDQLLTRFAELNEVEAISDIDKAVRQLPVYDREVYGKVWKSTTKHGEVRYKSLPVYIRNYFHHPKPGAEPSMEEINKSIELLRTEVNKLVDK